MKLIDEWKKAHKLWSVKLGVIGTILTTWLVASPDAALQAWLILPDEIKASIPSDYAK